MKRRILGVLAALSLFGAGFALVPQLASASPPGFQVISSTVTITGGTPQKLYCPSGKQEVSFGYSQTSTNLNPAPSWAFPFTDGQGSGYEFNFAGSTASETLYVVCTT